MMKDEAKERQLRELKEQTALELKEKNKKFQQRRRFIREAKKKEGRIMEEVGTSEYKKYIKQVEQSKSEQRRKERLQSEIDFENNRHKYDSMNSNFATFYERIRDRDQEIEENLQEFDNKMQRKHHASVMANIDKIERAREITEKMRVKQIEHELIEKKRMEEVFAAYMEKRIKAEEKVVSVIKCSND